MKLHNGLRIAHMNFTFSATKKFFNNVSLHCEPGKLNFLQGRNGSGKSTLFALLQGKVPPHAQLTGTFSIDEQETEIDHNHVDISFTKYITAVVQKVDEMVAPHFSVEHNIQCAQLPQYPGLNNLPPAQKMSLLHDFNINPHMRMEQLSGGQKQIVAIIMALQKPAKLLLLDEPTAALDPKNAHRVMQWLRKLAQTLHITILIISHDKELVQTYAPGYYFEITPDDNDVRTIHKVILE